MSTVNVENRNRYALITGATSGIGYELAVLFAQDSYNLILVARCEDRLQEVTNKLKQLYSVEVTPLAVNLFKSTAAQEIFRATSDMGIQIDVLVNNAGQGEWGPFAETALERDMDIIQLNVNAPVALTRLYLPEMLRRNEGRILQMGSEAGTMPMPLLSVYAATKAFILSFSAALSEELRDTNVTVTALLPGATDTDFFHKAKQDDTVTYREKPLLTPEKVARDGYEALMKGKNRVISGARTKLHVFEGEWLPTEKVASDARKLNEPSSKGGGEKWPVHAASMEERESIMGETGSISGDRKRR
ncbi:SDR family oxidoreductase [Chitinophaga oryzae]|uniref:SDR family oxidoreductase n=1 Tax=Chitinophaga oryzae TaxID=2725414 RepID=A0AAE6ZDU8_9BACT|nr:SDR family oxidoreductase [Chitinophaga oryzae]QJB30052.1 SDR family oxidoreductase [Chitinophaga oryzae]QJB36549.1 SDR family oxidoreductase [Chitinophaga oryzae]